MARANARFQELVLTCPRTSIRGKHSRAVSRHQSCFSGLSMTQTTTSAAASELLAERHPSGGRRMSSTTGAIARRTWTNSARVTSVSYVGVIVRVLLGLFPSPS